MNNGIVFLNPPEVSGEVFSSHGAVIPPGSRIIETGALHGIIAGEPAPDVRSIPMRASGEDPLIVQTRRGDSLRTGSFYACPAPNFPEELRPERRS
jgi:hypothetical protein